MRVDRVLAIIGIALLCWFAGVWARRTVYQREESAALDQPLVAYGVETPGQPMPPTPKPGDPIGRLEIPRLNLSVVVAEGDDDGTLDVAAGHLPDTPLPWADGNSAFAAHRDTLFRPIRHIKVDDEVRLLTPHGEFNYRVSKLTIVEPTDLWVLDPTGHDTLTLITCYPFNFIGHAPKRFIVQATRLAG